MLWSLPGGSAERGRVVRYFLRKICLKVLYFPLDVCLRLVPCDPNCGRPVKPRPELALGTWQYSQLRGLSDCGLGGSPLAAAEPSFCSDIITPIRARSLETNPV